jgi:hypothetical protein
MQVEYTDKAVAEADWKELEELVAPLHKSGAKHYTKLVKHSTKDLWVMAIVLIGEYKYLVEKWIAEKGLPLHKPTVYNNVSIN